MCSTPRRSPAISSCAGRGKGADQAGPGIGRAADDLHGWLAVARIDCQHAQPVGIRMLHRRQHLGDDKRLQARLVVDMLDFEAYRRQPLDDLVERGVGLEMIREPGEGEFDGTVPSGLLTLVFRCLGRSSEICRKASCSLT